MDTREKIIDAAQAAVIAASGATVVSGYFDLLIGIARRTAVSLSLKRDGRKLWCWIMRRPPNAILIPTAAARAELVAGLRAVDYVAESAGRRRSSRKSIWSRKTTGVSAVAPAAARTLETEGCVWSKKLMRILVVRLSSMGDVIHALPAVASLKHSFPHSRVSWVIRTRWMPLLEGNPFVDEVIPFERTVRGIIATRRKLREHKFDLAVDLQGLIQSAMVASAARPDRIVGFHRSQVREKAATLFYSLSVETRAPHVVDRNLELAAAAGASNLLHTFSLPQGSPEGILPDGKFVLASPLAGWGSKQWPVEFYQELAARLDVPLVVNGPPDASEILSKIRGAHVHLSGIAGLIDATRRAQAVVGVDSGPLHLAAALSKPGVAIFGPTDPLRNGPYGGTIRVLRSAGVVTTYKRVALAHDSMRAISPDDVLEALPA